MQATGELGGELVLLVDGHYSHPQHQGGSVIKGKPGGTNDASAPFVTQDSKIFAEGIWN